MAGRPRQLHQLLFPNVPPGHIVDHIDHDKLNNRRSNLHVKTYSGNTQNRKRKERDVPYIGVRKRHASSFYASLKFKGKAMSLGSYGTAEEAALAYNKKVLELYDRPRLNVIEQL